RQVAATSLGEPRQAAAIDLDDHGRADHVAEILADETQAEPARRFGRFIAKQRDRGVGVADDEVGPAVVVEIADGHAATARGGVEERAGVRADIPESALALLIDVVQQDRPLKERAAAARVQIDMTVGDDEVFPAVAVDVEEGGAEADELE